MHPKNLAKIDKQAAVIAVEIDLMSVAELEIKAVNFEEPSKFPGIDYDLSFVIPDGVRFENIEKAWKKDGIENLKNATVIDMYEADGVKSIAIRLTFSSDERTLSMEEVQANIDSILASLEEMGIALKTK